MCCRRVLVGCAVGGVHPLHPSTPLLLPQGNGIYRRERYAFIIYIRITFYSIWTGWLQKVRVQYSKSIYSSADTIVGHTRIYVRTCNCSGQ